MARKVLTKRSDGRYRQTVTYEAQDGSTKRHYVYDTTVKGVQDKAKEARDRLAAGAPVRDATRTVEDWVTEWLSTALTASDRSTATQTLYRGLLTRHVVPVVGSLTLGKIRPADVQRLILAMADKGLSPSTQRNAYAALRACLDDAVTNGLIAANPVRKVKRPKQDRQEAHSLTRLEAQTLLVAAQTNQRNRPDEEPRYHRGIRLLLLTGLRRGELLALRWEDIDLKRSEARVRGSLSRVDGQLVVSRTKTAASVRTVVLSPAAVDVLKAQRKSQAADKLRAANVWEETGHVFTTESGQPVDPRNFLRAVTTAAKFAGLGPDVGVHTLRHTYATAALEAGVPIHVVSRNLGHSSITITVDTYGHVTDDASRDAAARVADALGL